MVKKRHLIMLAVILLCTPLIVCHSTAYALQQEDGNIILDDSYVFYCYGEVDQYYRQLLYVHEDVLSDSTENLLEYFLKSDYMAYQRIREGLLSSPDLVRFVDYTEHPAFKELINREDFPSALEAYAKALLTDAKVTEDVMKIFEKLFEQPSIKSLFFEENNMKQDFPNLQNIYLEIGESR